MATYTKVKLSASTNGRNIKVAATSSPGTTIHTADATALDEVYLFACNNDAADVVLTIERGGTTSTDDLVKLTIPSKAGWIPVEPGIPLTGGVVVKAFAATTNVINIAGYVNRIA